MLAVVRTVRELFQSNEQYVIPFFQRSYAWKKKERELLWDDIQRLVTDVDLKSKHFLGPVVCSAVEHVPGGTKPYLLIDGQQRLTTLTIFLTALRDVAQEIGETGLAEQIYEDLLVNKRKEDSNRFKLLPRYHDAGVLKAIIESSDFRAFKDHEIYKAWRFTKRWINDPENLNPKYLQDIFVTITERLSLVVISIDKEEDPYEIFEGLNNRGIPLAESDLIRNFVFMKVPFPEQQNFHDKYWQPFESCFDNEKKKDSPQVQTAFFRHYLMRNGNYSHQKATFSDFCKRYKSEARPLEERMDEMIRLARVDREIRNPKLIDELVVRDLIEEIHALDVLDSARSLLLYLLDKYRQSKISLDRLEENLRDFVSFVLRRSVCLQDTRPYIRWFPSAIEQIEKEPDFGLREFLFAKGWPSDESVVESFSSAPIYKSNSKLTHLLLARIEQSYSHKERIALDELTIEHVMPQTLSGSWEVMLGEGWFEKHQRWVHAIGNLTLTGYNSELGNKEFESKRDSHFAESNLQLNKYFLDKSKWTDKEIYQRGVAVSQQVNKLWPRPRYDGPEVALAGPGMQPTKALTDTVRQFSIRRIQDHLNTELIPLEERQKAQFTDKQATTIVICLASKEYDEDDETQEGFWFAIKHWQKANASDYESAFLALCCGSPETVLLIPFAEFEQHLDDLNTTPDEEDKTKTVHWHISIRKKTDLIEMHLPRKSIYIDQSKYLI